jgi:hypothetical protein
MATPFIATRVYLKPLLPNEIFKGDLDAIAQKTKGDLLRRIKKRLTQTTFSDRAKKAFAKAIKIEIKPSSIQVTANHPGFAPMLRGQRKGQMKWLKKARRPIPIITESGKLIFRTASARSMKNGKWMHPGRAPSDFVERAKAESRMFLKDKFKKELRQQVRKAWSKPKR